MKFKKNYWLEKIQNVFIEKALLKDIWKTKIPLSKITLIMKVF